MANEQRALKSANETFIRRHAPEPMPVVSYALRMYALGAALVAVSFTFAALFGFLDHSLGKFFGWLGF